MKVSLSVISLIVLILCLGSCDSPVVETSANKGNLILTVNDKISRSAHLDIPMEPVWYQASGAGPQGASFNEIFIDSLTIENLISGEWTLQIDAYNEADQLIGAGSATASISRNNSTHVNIEMTPLDGIGTLDLTLSWTEGKLSNPQVEASLTGASGTPRVLDMSILGSQATYNASDIDSGFYSLAIQLHEGTTLVAGAVEVIRIASGGTTTGAFSFDQLNLESGSLEIQLSPHFPDSLDVEILGSGTQKMEYAEMTLSASVSNYDQNITCIWYSNGEALSTGESYVLGDSLPVGNNRIDLAVYSTDGEMAGSDSIYVNVIPFTLEPGTFASKWRVENQILTLPMDSEGNYDFSIDWGDGNTEQITASPNNFISHSYNENGIYYVKISGICQGFGGYRAYATSDKEGELLDILQWGNLQLHNKGYQLANFPEITVFSAEDELDISNLTNISHLFYNCSHLNQNFSNWDTSNIVDMSGTFSSCDLYNQDLSTWQTHNVESMRSMFAMADNFDQDISGWDVSKVTNMTYMFMGCWDFKQNLSDWDVSSVTEMYQMFKGCYKFNNDISDWDTGSVTTMYGMFDGCDAFNQDISSWDVSNVTNMAYMFESCFDFNQDISGWDTGNVVYMYYMLRNCKSFTCGNIEIDQWIWDVGKVEDARNMFQYSHLYSREPSWYGGL